MVTRQRLSTFLLNRLSHKGTLCLLIYLSFVWIDFHTLQLTRWRLSTENQCVQAGMVPKFLIFFLLTIFFFLKRLLSRKLIGLWIVLTSFAKLQAKRSTIIKLKFISLRIWITNFMKKSYFILVLLMSIVWVDTWGLIQLLVDPLKVTLGILPTKFRINLLDGNNNV